MPQGVCCAACVDSSSGEAGRALMVELRLAGWRERGGPVLTACPRCALVAEATTGWHFLCGGGGEGRSRCALAPSPPGLWRCLLGL